MVRYGTCPLRVKIDRMIRNLVFDFGGVIVDLDFDRAVEAFRSIGLPRAEHMLDKYKQRGIFLDVETGVLTAEGFLHGLSKLCGRKIGFDEAQQAWLAFLLPPDPRRLETLERLRKGHRLFLLSNTNPFIMDWARSPRFSPGGKPLDDYFDKLYLSYEMGVVKPDRDIFLKMMLDAELDPAFTLFVDDGRANVEAAAALGFPTYQPRPGCDWTREVERLAGIEV